MHPFFLCEDLPPFKMGRFVWRPVTFDGDDPHFPTFWERIGVESCVSGHCRSRPDRSVILVPTCINKSTFRPFTKSCTVMWDEAGIYPPGLVHLGR